MERDDLSRRSLLHAIAATIGLTAVPSGWFETVEAAHVAAQPGGGPKLSWLSAADAADLDAITAQIIPTDDTPGAREAGVVYFIDRALAGFLSQLARDYRAELAEFQALCRKQHASVASFARLSSDQQIAFLKTVDRTPFFDTTRLLTLLGMFSVPEYGGNRGGAGWALIGFEDRHFFQPPFGYYDRDYPGFAAEGTKTP